MSTSVAFCVRRVGVWLLVMLLSGCAIQSNGRGGITMGVDTAEIFGTELERFPLADGGQGVLRREAGRYSIKFPRYQRVVALPAATTSARIARVQTLGQRTAVVIETVEPACALRYTLLAIEGSTVSHWEFGNCQDRPVAMVDPGTQAMAFDLPAGGMLRRHVYTPDGRFLVGLTDPPPGMSLSAKPFADAQLQLYPHAPSANATRFVPEPPQRQALGRGAGQRARNAASARQASGGRRGSSPTTSTTPWRPTSLNLSQQEIPAVRLDLLKD